MGRQKFQSQSESNKGKVRRAKRKSKGRRVAKAKCEELSAKGKAQGCDHQLGTVRHSSLFALGPLLFALALYSWLLALCLLSSAACCAESFARKILTTSWRQR